MSSLVETYALQCGVHIGNPYANDTFFPLETSLDKVILIHAFAGAIADQNGQKVATMPAKIFDHFNEVISLLAPVIEPLGYRFYQIGGGNEPLLKGATSLCGKTTMSQCAYLVKRAALLIGNDSQWAHERGWFKQPLVEVFGSTAPGPHGPYWKDPEKTVLLESHRSGKKPSFSGFEQPKTVNFVPPEQIAQASLDLLHISQSLTHSTCYIGPEYNLATFDIIPNMVVPPQTQIGVPTLRMDLHFDEKVLAQNLSVRKCAIVTDREIDLNILAQFKPQIAGLRIIVDKLSADWIKKVRRIGIPIQAVCDEKDSEKVAALRLSLYDACLFDTVQEPTRDDLIREIGVYLNKSLDTDFNIATLSFKSNRFLLSSGKIYLSISHWRKDRPVESTDKNSEKVIDESEFWEQQRGHYYFTT